ncbi:MAG: GNAT family N-acetyltransferase [Bacteroidota bacterium]
MNTIIETERLIIREMGQNDINEMLALHSDPEVHRYLGNKTITSRKKMEQIINSLVQQYDDYGVGRWAMIHKQTKAFIGWTGLEFVTKTVNQHQNFYDLGYRLVKTYWGQGFATESAIASIQYGFDQLNLPTINAMADKENGASNYILKKIGLQFVKNFEFEGVPHHWYQLEKAEYHQSEVF